MEALEFALGVAVVAIVLADIFQSVLVPRPTPGPWRPSALVIRGSWPAWRELCLGSARRERLLGSYAPMVLVAVLLLWLVGLVLGFGLALHGLRAQIRPAPADLAAAVYFAGTSLLTIGFGDIVATEGLARATALAAGAAGLGIVALVIAFVFSLFASFQRREALVVTLDARAGAPPSGLRLLETYAESEMLDDLARTFAEWERWAGEVLDTHIAYPILAYFRSSHDNESWISALGAVLDAATLLLTTVASGPRGQARMLHEMGDHLVEDLVRYFRLRGEPEVGVERAEFDEAYRRLAAAGYRLRDAEDAWRAFREERSTYAGRLNALARHWAVPPAQWIGDRSYVRHAS